MAHQAAIRAFAAQDRLASQALAAWHVRWYARLVATACPAPAIVDRQGATAPAAPLPAHGAGEALGSLRIHNMRPCTTPYPSSRSRLAIRDAAPGHVPRSPPVPGEALENVAQPVRQGAGRAYQRLLGLLRSLII